MAKSAKRKREEKSDFKKPKLKVGKTKAKAANATDTSFQAKGLVIKTQFTNTTDNGVAHFRHHLSLVTSKNEHQRRDSIIHLTTIISSIPAGTSFPVPPADIIAKVQSLALDASLTVREQLLKLLRAFPPKDVQPHAGSLLLWTRAGLSHLSSSIRASSCDLLQWLLETAPLDAVSSAGGWVKTLKTFLTVLTWRDTDAHASEPRAKVNGWTSIGNASSSARPGSDKLKAKQMTLLAGFVQAGLTHDQVEYAPNFINVPDLVHHAQHMMPDKPNPYAYLNLYDEPRDEEDEMYDGREDRQRAYHKYAARAVREGIKRAKTEGGEVGRAAALLRRVVDEGMRDFLEDEDDL